jgi:ABC-type sugar transport system ATPase subunit
MNLGENLLAAMLARVSKSGVINGKKERELVTQWSKRLSIKSAGVAAPITSLSGGNQQKVLLARLMATSPKLLMLDEPTRGIDVATKQEIHRDVRELARSGMAILLISSELVELLELADEVHVLHEGTKSTTLVGEQINEKNVLRAAVGVGA